MPSEQTAVALLGALSKLLAEVSAVPLRLDVPDVDVVRKRQGAVVDQLSDYVIPRLVQLDAPLLTVVGGRQMVPFRLVDWASLRARSGQDGTVRRGRPNPCPNRRNGRIRAVAQYPARLATAAPEHRLPGFSRTIRSSVGSG